MTFREGIFLKNKIEYPVYTAKRYRYPTPKTHFEGGIELNSTAIKSRLS